MNERTARHRLAVLWFVGTGTVFLLMVAQHMGGTYMTEAAKAWGWFTGLVMPTPSLIVGTLVAEARTTTPRAREVEPQIYYLCVGASLFYLALVVVALVWHMFSSRPAVDLMQDATLFLGIVQTTVTLAMGVFFVSPK